MDHLTSGCGSQVVSMLPDMSLWDLFHSQFTLICINPYNMTGVSELLWDFGGSYPPGQ